MGPKKLAILTGWPYYQGRVKFHDFRVVNPLMTKYVAFTLPEKPVLFNKQWECRCTKLYKILELLCLLKADVSIKIYCLSFVCFVMFVMKTGRIVAYFVK